MTGSTSQGILIWSFLTFSVTNSAFADVLNGNGSLDNVPTETEPDLPGMSVTIPITTEKERTEIVETTEPVSLAEYDLINDTSLEDSGNYYVDYDNSTDLVMEEPSKEVPTYETDRYSFTTVTDSRGARLLHYSGWSAMVVFIVSLVFITGYITWKMASKISNLSLY